MQREIKFRAFDAGKMIYFNDIQHLSKEDYEVLRLAKFFCNIRNDSIIMQITGLQDKKKVDCYEGDILENTEGKRGVVVFYDGGFRLQTHKGETSVHYISMNQGYMENKTIIGNIYENPDLLK